MRSKYPKNKYCKECLWAHEVDTDAGTSFLGVKLCPKHAAAPALLAACKFVLNEISGAPRTGMLLIAKKKLSSAIAKAER